jgi:hypothetical protein
MGSSRAFEIGMVSEISKYMHQKHPKSCTYFKISIIYLFIYY